MRKRLTDDAFMRTALLVVVAACLAVALTELATAAFAPPKGGTGGHIPRYVRVSAFVSTATLLLLCSLLVTYGRLYLSMPNYFTLGLVVFVLSLSLFALTSNPLTPLVVGHHAPTTGGPFTLLPNLFASAAVVILRYQSYA